MPFDKPSDGIELKAIEDYTKERLIAVANDLYSLLGKPATRSQLHARGRNGTLSRYGQNPMEGFRYLRELQLQAAERTASELSNPNVADIIKRTHLGAFVVTYLGCEVIGLATCQENLPLYLPNTTVVPAALERKLAISIPLITPSTNVSGWIDAEARRDIGVQSSLASVYRSLRSMAPESWTVEPLSADATNHEAIISAGYIADGLPARYDELETAWYPPKAQLYRAPGTIISS